MKKKKKSTHGKYIACKRRGRTEGLWGGEEDGGERKGGGRGGGREGRGEEGGGGEGYVLLDTHLDLNSKPEGDNGVPVDLTPYIEC